MILTDLLRPLLFLYSANISNSSLPALGPASLSLPSPISPLQLQPVPVVAPPPAQTDTNTNTDRFPVRPPPAFRKQPGSSSSGHGLGPGHAHAHGHAHGHAHHHAAAAHARANSRALSERASWVSVGCVTDGAARALTGAYTSSGDMTVEKCQAACAGWAYAGLEYGNECFCDNTLRNGLGQTAPPGDCSMSCAGNGAESCGAGFRLNLYSNGAVAASAPSSAWQAVGCVTDGAARALTGLYTSAGDMTVEKCQAACAGYTYAGLEYGNECFCDNTLRNGLGLTAPNGDCNMACAGNGAEACGAGFRLNLYTYGASPTSTSTSTSTSHTTTTTSTSTGPTSTAGKAWQAVGCVTDGAARALTGAYSSAGDMTVEKCQAACAGYAYAGLEYGNECFCDNALQNGLGLTAPSGDCSMTCAGNGAEACGAGFRLNLYTFAASPTSTSTSTSSASSTSHTSTSTTTGSATKTWQALGCVTDGPARALAAYFTQQGDNTVELCTAQCAAAGYSLAGVEYGTECHCDNALMNGLGQSAPSADCNMGCAGNGAEACGGNYRLDLYTFAAATGPTSTTTKTGTSTSTSATATSTAMGWTAVGCAVDASARVLTGSSTTSASLTVEGCQSSCLGAGYTYAGVENGDECYCGNTLANGGFTAGTGCTTACAGKSAEMCGGGWRINIYSYGAVSGSVTSTSTKTTSTSTAASTPTDAPQIWDIWYTRNDQSALFQRVGLSSPITFTTPGAIGQADIVVDDAQVYQDIDGFGASLTDSSALMLTNLKNANANNYWTLLHTLFDTTDGSATAGLSIIRVPLGASDFSASVYSYHDNYDPNLGSFNINAAPSYLWSVLADILSVNGALKIMVAPWSPPGWMKDSGTMLGGTFQSQYTSTLANYLLKSVQGFQSKGFTVSHVAIQNEPENNNPTYPTCLLDPGTEANVAGQLRSLLNNNGFGSVKILAWEHNWDQAGAYPVTALNDNSGAFSGASFHCYEGAVQDQMDFYNAYPNKEIYFTECVGTLGSDWWSDIKYDMSNLMIGSLAYMSRTVVMWAVALDGGGNPKLPGTDSCGGPGCRGVVTVNYDGTYSLNQEYYSLAQASRAVVPKDAGGPWGQRIGSTINGNLNYELIVGAYKTGRSAAANTDWNRYSLVVVNWNDQANAGPVTTTIEFRGLQATYSFPIGVTTLWWFAEN